jgi:hypothetical protein
MNEMNEHDYVNYELGLSNKIRAAIRTLDELYVQIVETEKTRDFIDKFYELLCREYGNGEGNPSYLEDHESDRFIEPAVNIDSSDLKRLAKYKFISHVDSKRYILSREFEEIEALRLSLGRLVDYIDSTDSNRMYKGKECVY